MTGRHEARWTPEASAQPTHTHFGTTQVAAATKGAQRRLHSKGGAQCTAQHSTLKHSRVTVTARHNKTNTHGLQEWFDLNSLSICCHNTHLVLHGCAPWLPAPPPLSPASGPTCAPHQIPARWKWGGGHRGRSRVRQKGMRKAVIFRRTNSVKHITEVLGAQAAKHLPGEGTCGQPRACDCAGTQLAFEGRTGKILRDMTQAGVAPCARFPLRKQVNQATAEYTQAINHDKHTQLP